MTDEFKRQPAAALTETTETVFKRFNEEKGTFENVHVIVPGRVPAEAIWES